MCSADGPPRIVPLADVPAPVAGVGEVVIATRAASLNFPDLLIIQNKYQVKPPLPFSPGSETAGVSSSGEGVETASPRRSRDGVHDVRRVRRTGESCRAPRLRASRHTWTSTAAAFLLTYGTSDHALRDRAQLASGETLLVLGASGGVGIAAIEIGKAVGARVIACASSPDKLALCREHGADETINYARSRCASGSRS